MRSALGCSLRLLELFACLRARVDVHACCTNEGEAPRRQEDQPGDDHLVTDIECALREVAATAHPASHRACTHRHCRVPQQLRRASGSGRKSGCVDADARQAGGFLDTSRRAPGTSKAACGLPPTRGSRAAAPRSLLRRRGLLIASAAPPHPALPSRPAWPRVSTRAPQCRSRRRSVEHTQ